MSRFDVMLFLLGIFDGELLALLTTCNNPFSKLRGFTGGLVGSVKSPVEL